VKSLPAKRVNFINNASIIKIKPAYSMPRLKKTTEHYTKQNKLQLVRGGKPYFDCLIGMIERAKESIQLQTYIFDVDETGRIVADALKAAAQRKVKVYVLVDGYASKKIPRAFIQELTDAGIHFRFFNPLFKSEYFYFGRRLHHKITVVDTRYALAGGVNITNRYNDMPDEPAWLDFALFLEGEAAMELCVHCWKTWKNYPTRKVSTPCEQKQVHFPAGDASEVSVRRNDWVRRRNQISATYINMFRNAKSHITILCAYFLPGRVIRRQLRYATERGVKIKVITAGVSDVKISKYAERYMYGWMLRHGIELYEYQPTVLHGKIAVCDGAWMTIGSYNVNDISAYASIELNMNVRNKPFSENTEKMLLQIAEKDCVQVTSEYYRRSGNLIIRFARWLSYKFFRFMFVLSTFYFKHRP
jgi:cardiolipin synthase